MNILTKNEIMKSKIEEKIKNAREATNEMFAAFEELNEKLSERICEIRLPKIGEFLYVEDMPKIESRGDMKFATLNADTINEYFRPLGGFYLKFKAGDYLTMHTEHGKYTGILSKIIFRGNEGFPYFVGINPIGNINFNSAYGFQKDDSIFFATQLEAALLDSKLAEQGKRFDKEKLELVDIPKFQVGDWFIPHKPTGRNEYLAWAMGMDKFENVPQQIREIRLNGNIIAYSSDYAFHPDWCEKTTAPKHKEPIIGELAIGWYDGKKVAMVGILSRVDKTKMPYFIGGYWFRNAILFESTEQYKAFLKS